MLGMPSDSSLKRLRIITFSLVMVLVPFIVYYYFYVSNQTKYFTGRDLRVLAALSRHVEESVESQGEVFTNAVKRYLADREVPDEEDEGEPTKAGESVFEKLKKPTEKLRFQRRALDPLKGDGTNLTITNLDVVAAPADESSMVTPKIEIRQEENQRWLYFDYTTSYPPPAVASYMATGQPSVEGKGRPPIYLNFKVRANIASLVGQFVNKRQIEDNQGSYEGDGFDAIVIAEVDDAVNVIFQESSSKLRIASLNNLTKVSDGAKIDLKLLGQSTNLADVRVGAGEYKLFFQPVQLPLARLGGAGKGEINWIACGFVESGRFRRESWAVSYTVLIYFGFTAVLIALSWPFLKLLLIGPKDRFRPIDTYLLVVSAVMITALLTLFASYIHSYGRSEGLLDKELETFSRAIKENFNKEVGSALKQIDALNCHPKLLEAPGFTRPKKCEETNNTPPVSQTESQPMAQQVTYGLRQPRMIPPDVAARRRILAGDKPEDKLTHYPYFISAFWADNRGSQRIKWTTRPNLTNNVPVAQREFFYKLRQGLHYSYGDHEFFLQPIVSRTTGQSEVVISKAIYPYDDRRMWVSGLLTRPLSLMQPVVPSGFGFAVIDDEGKVLFHSDEKQHLGENFFEECDNNQALRAAVLGRSKQSLTASYLGKGHSMHLRPMGQFGWTVVVFRNKDYLRTTFSEILTLCLVLFFTYLLAMLVVILILYLMNRKGKDRATWLWPAPDKKNIYISLAALNVVLAILSAASVRLLPGLWKIGAPVGVAFAAVFLFVWILKRSKESKIFTELIERFARLRVINHRRVYLANATLLFALISIIPAYTCFKLAYAEEMKLFVKEGQLSLARSLADREDRVRAQYGLTNVAGNKQSPMEAFLQERLNDTKYDVYEKFFYATTLHPAGRGQVVEPQDNKLIRFFKSFVPLFNQSSIERHALMWPTADDSWKWEASAADKLVLRVDGALTNTQRSTPRNIVSTLPRLNGSLWWLIWPILLAIVALLVTYMSRHIFLFRRDEARSDGLGDLCPDSISQSLFLVLNPPFIGKRELLKRMGLDQQKWDRIDIEQTAEVERWIEECKTPEPSDGEKRSGCRPLMIDNFDFAIEDSSHNQRRLSLLEKIHELKRIAVAVSNYDPDRFMQTNGNSDGSTAHHNGSTPVITERWTGAFSRFLKVTVEDDGDPKDFRDALRARKEQLLADEQLTAEARAQIESLFETLDHECSPRACLQSIGEGIANQRNIIKQAPATIIKQVLVQAIPYYKSIWRVCSDDEKLTLSHLAQDGLLSSNDPDIEPLMKKGLIVREPAIRLMNESFKAFVLGVGDGKALAHCEAEARKSSNWEVLKVPLTIGVTSVMGFLLLTQREVYNSALPLITALTAGVPSFFKLISLFQGDSGGKGGG